ncbi:MAG: carboxylating nicotinate-nucleotide diphosphorylase [Alphaproteobacteria bacterium]
MARASSNSARRGPGAPDPFDHPSTHELVARGLEEDVGRGDVTTAATVDPGARGRTALVAREECVVAGLPLVEIVLEAVAGRGREAPAVSIEVEEGEVARRGRKLAVIEGSLSVTLIGERLLLNLVQHLCGIATETRRYVRAVAGTRAAIVDTRKTLPGLRLLQKYAVRCGGGRNHRFGLDDGVLIKDNHVAACGSVAAAIRSARAAVPHSLRVEVECDRMSQVEGALRAGADAILLDNMTPAEVAAAVRRIDGRALVEVSGGVNLDTVRAHAESGADLVSIGRLTHSVRAVDVGLDFLSRQAGRRRPRARRS